MLKISLVTGLILAVANVAVNSGAFADVNPDLELQSQDGYSIHIHSQLQPLAINQIHSWLMELTDANGPVAGAEITVQGGMPEHDHGLPTQPLVTREVSPGREPR